MSEQMILICENCGKIRCVPANDAEASPCVCGETKKFHTPTYRKVKKAIIDPNSFLSGGLFGRAGTAVVKTNKPERDCIAALGCELQKKDFSASCFVACDAHIAGRL